MDRVLTIPNAISAARIAGVPVFLWLVLGPRTAVADDWAVGILMAAGLSDWLDGKIARALNQGSRLGQVLDPAADRLYIAATIVALAVRGIIPWWLVAVLALRELTVGAALAVLRRRAGFGTLQVSLVGKGATLCLLYAFPLLFLGDHSGSPADGGPGHRLGLRGLGDGPVLVGRGPVPGPGAQLGEPQRERVTWRGCPCIRQ